ncbi:helix-turn-helix domain-containing protein [Aeromonas sp. sif2416]|jgi:transcriptional regulator with XRE-family HTH domain|uniref:helix-turn-helix domain-containing protein n=1 Tax=Aeromonas sp. sif2416 TaxID=2854793 RepID=UPI001C48BD03|nr:helix-turn-helix transcriptional regulator [Aeromonas sp. sif2416]MBV7437079.1 helix-turn-helix domain-containing protein [Aeromonas sp. sif2416]
MSKLTSTDVDTLLGKRIQQRRKELGISAAQLAEALGFSQQQLSRYERGLNRISATLLVDVAGLLDTPVEWFLLDCPTKLTAIVQPTQSLPYGPEKGLKKRLDQQWSSLTLEKQQALVQFLDVY